MKKFSSALLLLLVIISALGVVYVKHQNRLLFVELRELQKQRDEMEVDWGRLQLEQSTWATHARIEEVARRKLAMRNVEYNEAVIVKP